jgi:Pyruvate/2-oxoacid:ferredoxin oxidoreductase delta subunit
MSSQTDYQPMKRFIDNFPGISGNEINGLGETEIRRPSPFFWHPPDRQTHGALQKEVTDYHRQSNAVRKWFSSDPPGGRGPEALLQSEEKISRSPAEWSAIVKEFTLANESDLVGIADVDPMWVYEGYAVDEPRVIVIGVAMDYAELAEAPSSFENPRAAVVVAKEYNRAARACRELRNFILAQGYFAKAFQGPYATALNFLPAAIAAGLGELGKHGSLINRQYGSSFRLSAVTTDMPLIADSPDDFGADDFCMRCQACANACPPDAIFNDKQMVRGVEKWYVDFDKCIPYFGETLGCALCLAQCPWSRPGNSANLIQKLQKRAARLESAE